MEHCIPAAPSTFAIYLTGKPPTGSELAVSVFAADLLSGRLPTLTAAPVIGWRIEAQRTEPVLQREYWDRLGHGDIYAVVTLDGGPDIYRLLAMLLAGKQG